MRKHSGKSNISIVRDYLNGERPFTQVGYTGDINKYLVRKVGETWTDSSGKKWIQKESGPESVTTVLDIVRKEMNDMKCVKCGAEIRWGTKLDRKMFYKTKKCFDCLIQEETLLRARGQYKLYEQKKLLQNELSYLKVMKDRLKDGHKYVKEHKVISYPNSNGTLEVWENEGRDKLMSDIRKDFIACLKEIKRVEKELHKVEKEVDSVISK